MIPIVSVVGRPGSGKTTLLEALLPLLRSKGYRIGVVKHGVHGFDVDKDGKDSWRHAQAGAEVALISTPKGLAVFRRLDQEMSPEELIETYLPDMDFVLAEGFKRERMPKIEIHRQEVGERLLKDEEEGLLAVVSDVPVSTKLPLFSPHGLQPLADLIEERFLRGRSKEEVQLSTDGRRVALNPFVQDLFRSLLLAMVSPLKGIVPFTRLTLRLDIRNEKKAANP
jgi:molybdopterin-guanine dinucleotide biosynthesis adapter protein